MLTGDKFTLELYLRRPGFTYSAFGLFTKHHECIQKFKETGNLNYIYKNELEKSCFAHDAAYADSKDLAKRTVSDKVSKDRAYDIALNPKYDRYQRGFIYLFIYLFISHSLRLMHFL